MWKSEDAREEENWLLKLSSDFPWAPLIDVKIIFKN